MFGGVIRDAAEMPGDQNSTPETFKTARFYFQPIPAPAWAGLSAAETWEKDPFMTHLHELTDWSGVKEENEG